jgi:hypothetical protein
MACCGVGAHVGRSIRNAELAGGQIGRKVKKGDKEMVDDETRELYQILHD